MNILTHIKVSREENGSHRCSQCHRQVSTVYPLKFRSENLCSDCIFGGSSGRGLNESEDQQAISGPGDQEIAPRQIKLTRCYGCNSAFANERMSTLALLCKTCVEELRAEDQRQRDRSVTKILSRVKMSLRRQI